MLMPNMATINQNPARIAIKDLGETEPSDTFLQDMRVATAKFANPHCVFTAGRDLLPHGLRARTWDRPQMKWGMPLPRSAPIRKYQRSDRFIFIPVLSLF